MNKFVLNLNAPNKSENTGNSSYASFISVVTVFTHCFKWRQTVDIIFGYRITHALQESNLEARISYRATPKEPPSNAKAIAQNNLNNVLAPTENTLETTWHSHKKPKINLITVKFYLGKHYKNVIFLTFIHLVWLISFSFFIPLSLRVHCQLITLFARGIEEQSVFEDPYALCAI